MNDLITKVQKEANCFDGLYKADQYIEQVITSVAELSLITNYMIKEETKLTLDFSKKTVTN